MKLLSYAYRFLSNFVFLASVYYSLNFLEKYQQRAVVAILVLLYCTMRAASALRSFHFFQRIFHLAYLNRFQQVVQRSKLYGLQGIFLEGSYKDHFKIQHGKHFQ